MTTLNEDLIYEILSAVEEIPAGKVGSILSGTAERQRCADGSAVQKAWVDRTGRKDH